MDVSLVLLCYNHAPFATQALESIRRQTRPPTQLIVTDDASTDGTAAIVERWLTANWPDATFIAHAENRGLTRTLNEAMAHVSGDAVAVLAADDWMREDRLEVQANVLATSDAVSMVHSDMTEVSESGALGRRRSEAEAFVPPSGDLYHAMFRRGMVFTPTVLVRTTALDAVGPHDESLFTEDYDMWLRLSRDHSWHYVPEPLVFYRIHAGSMSQGDRFRWDAREQRLRILKKHLGHDRVTDRIVWTESQRLAIWLYERGRSASATAAELGPVLWRRTGFQVLLYWGLARCRVPGRLVRRARQWVRTSLQRVRRTARGGSAGRDGAAR